MDTDNRPTYRCNSSSNNNNTGCNSSTSSELFICFTSRLSASSSMKISSKSILSPGRSREPASQISLSNSLSRRLRTNGSMKGGQASPMFPSNGKKRGCSFENPEPSSPKVTCIGQVRVKTKKQGRKMRGSRSQRRGSGGGGGEVSFRRVEQGNSNSDANGNNLEVSNGSHHQDFSYTHQGNNQQECLRHRNQRWVHLPLTICEALRAFGAEFNCFLPCRSSCMASEKEKQGKAAASGGGGGSSERNSCGALFARWLVAVEESDRDGKRREIELVVGEQEEEDFSERRRSYRRHVFEEIEFTDDKFGVGNDEQDEEAAKVSICIPPKNALLLMRCRSDPVKMAALANKFWEPPLPNNEDEKDKNKDEVEEHNNPNEEKEEDVSKNKNVEVGSGDDVGKTEVDQEMEQRDDLVEEKVVFCQAHETEVALEEEEEKEQEHGEDDQEARTEIDGVKEEATSVQQEEQTQQTLMGGLISSHNEEEAEDPEKLKIQENKDDVEESSVYVSVHQEEANQESRAAAAAAEEEEKEELAILELKEEVKEVTAEETCTQEHGQEQEEEEEEVVTSATIHERSESESESEEDPKTQEEETGMKSNDVEETQQQEPLLPDCLLLMMCEPKLSMEVSKETWVCSTDFIRWLPEHSRPPQVKKKDGGDQPKKRISIDNNNTSNNPPSVQGNLQQPPRSSCSYPAKPPARAAGAESMTTAIEKKLVGTKAYEPFVLTRCKSEPMRSAAKLAPEACFWKNRKLEPHRPATLGVGAAGVGF